MKKIEKFIITGMHCAACQATIENTLKKTDGVESVNVSLINNKMVIKYDDEILNNDKIKKIITSIGYKGNLANEIKKDLSIEELKKAKKRLLITLSLGLPLIIIVMCAMFHIKPFVTFAKYYNGIYYVILQISLIIPIIIINFHYFSNGFKTLFRLHPNMDSLIAIGATCAIGYSIVNLISFYFLKNNIDPIHGFYFETAGMILTFVSIGKYLEASSKAKTNDATKKLLELMPLTCNKVLENKIEVVNTSDIEIGNIILVKPGEQIPLDGIIIEGNTYIDESSVTGESMPVKKTIGDSVVISTINKNGSIKVEVTSTIGNTWIDKMVELVEEASSSKAKVERIADKISLYFVPTIILIALITYIIWEIYAKTSVALMNAISVLVIACPCSLGLATPTSIMVGMGKGATNGILFKNAESLETLGKIDRLVFDKTGTITTSKPHIVNIINFDETNDEILKIASSLEINSEHPLARAIVNSKIIPYEVTNFKNHSGKGISGDLKIASESKKYYIGSYDFIKNIINQEILKINTPTTKVYLANDEKLIAIIEIIDQIKDNANKVINELKSYNIATVLATGDNEEVAKYVQKEVGIEEVYYKMLPEDKMNYIKKCKSQGENVAMIGDGINDSIALSVANVGISIGAGTDIAKESADVILVKNDLEDVVNAIYLSKKVMTNIKQNLFWALIYNSIGVIMTTGLYYLITKTPFNPMFASIAMSLSSVCVVTNALRLRNVKFKQKENISKGDKQMTKTIIIEGMMCPNCERHVKTALCALGVDAVVSHKDKKAVVTGDNLNNDALTKAVVDAGYVVVDIK